MHSRADALDVLYKLRDNLSDRMSERILESAEDLLDDAMGESYRGEIELLYEQFGAKLVLVNQMIGSFPVEAHVPSSQFRGPASDVLESDEISDFMFDAENEFLLSSDELPPQTYTQSHPAHNHSVHTEPHISPTSLNPEAGHANSLNSVPDHLEPPASIELGPHDPSAILSGHALSQSGQTASPGQSFPANTNASNHKASGTSLETTWGQFLRQIRCRDIFAAGEAFSLMSSLPLERTELAASHFLMRVDQDAGFLEHASQLVDDVRLASVNDVLEILYGAFGLEGDDALTTLVALRPFLARELSTSQDSWE